MRWFTGVFVFLTLEQKTVLVCRCVLILDLRTGGVGCVGIQVCYYS